MPVPDAPRRDDLVDRLWRFASAPRLSLALGAAVALAWAGAAVLNPSGATRAELERTLGLRVWWRAYQALDLDDLLGTSGFALLVAALALSALACAIEHLPRRIRAALRPDRLLTDEVARGLPGSVRLPGGPEVGSQSARLAEDFRVRGFHPQVAAAAGDECVYLYAERGRWSRLGAPLAALGGAMALAGGLAWRVWGWEGTVEIPVGGGASAVTVRRGSGALRQPLPFAVRVNDVEVPAPEDGRGRRPRTNLSLLDRDGRPLPARQAVDLLPGRKLSQSGVTISQEGHREDPGGPRAEIAIVDRASRRRLTFLVARGEEVQAGEVRFAVMAYTPRHGNAGAAAQIQRTEGSARSEFWVFQAQPDFDARNRPDRYAIEFLGLRQAWLARLRIAHDAGAAAVLWTGAALVAAGLLLALLGPHRRLWARVEPGAVLLAGASHRRARRFDALRAELEATLSRADPARKGAP